MHVIKCAPCCRTKAYRCINMYAWKWQRSPIPSSRPSAAPCGNSEISPLYFLSFSPQFSGFLSSCALVSQPIRTLSPGPARPRPLHLATVRCLDSVSQGSRHCRLSRLSATLSRFLLVPLLPSALPVLSPPSFRGA